jgi:hypothetical protein
MRRSFALALTTLLTLAVVTGCGTKSKSSDEFAGSATSAEEPYVTAFSKQFTKKDSDEDFAFTKAQGDCVATRMVKIIGVPELEKAGVTPENAGDDDSMKKVKLTEAQGNDIYDSFDACDANLRDAIMKSMTGDETVTPAMKTCFEGALTEESLRKMIVAGLITGDDESPEAQAAFAPLLGCAFLGMGDATTTTG